MSDQTTVDEGQATEAQPEVDPNAAISRGVGLSFEAMEGTDPNTPAGAAWAAFKDLVKRHQDAEAAAEELKLERNRAIYDLKTEHNVGFSAMAEPIGATSSLVLYLFERAQGKSAKQIREESVASRLAKEATRVDDPNKKPARKQTPEEKAFRKQQRDALRAFLEEQRTAAAARGESTDEMDAGLAETDREEAADASE